MKYSIGFVVNSEPENTQRNKHVIITPNDVLT